MAARVYHEIVVVDVERAGRMRVFVYLERFVAAVGTLCLLEFHAFANLYAPSLPAVPAPEVYTVRVVHKIIIKDNQPFV